MAPFNDQSEPLLIVDAQTSLPTPPTAYGVLPGWWDRDDAVISEFDLDLWGSTTMTLTSGELVAAIQHPLTYADNTITSLDHTSDVFNETAHALKTGDGPIQLTTSGVLPEELALATNYWVIRVDANSFKLASSLANALSGTVVAFGDNGSGTVTVVDVPGSTGRIYWHSYGALPTPISLTVDKAFSIRSFHRGKAVAYGVVGTLSAGALSAAVTPVIEV